MRIPRITILSALLLALFALPRAQAYSNDDALLDPAQLTQLEARADHAAPKEQCFLLTELVHNYTAIAGKELADGETEKATATLKRVQGYVARIHAGLARDTSKVKNAEMLMHTTARSLGEYLHHASADDKVVVEATLKQLEKVNDELLAQVFTH
jgi:hypothetical protein